VGTIYHGTAKQYWIGKVEESHQDLLASWRENGNEKTATGRRTGGDYLAHQVNPGDARQL